MSVSVASIGTNFKNNLQLSPYKMRKRQYLTPAQKHKRLETKNILLEELKSGTAEPEIDYFSDEQLFTIEAIVNNQNDRVYAKSLADIDNSVRTVHSRQKPFPPWCGLQSPNVERHL